MAKSEKGLVIPKLPWLKMSKAQRLKLEPHIRCVSWKHEGKTGPVHIEFKKWAQEEGTFFPGWVSRPYDTYEDSTPEWPEPVWYTHRFAEKLAEELNTKLED